jgi:hypothetical protein
MLRASSVVRPVAAKYQNRTPVPFYVLSGGQAASPVARRLPSAAMIAAGTGWYEMLL